MDTPKHESPSSGSTEHSEAVLPVLPPEFQPQADSEREHWIVTIRLEVDKGTNVKNIVDMACDRMQECEGNAHVYDANCEQETE